MSYNETKRQYIVSLFKNVSLSFKDIKGDFRLISCDIEFYANKHNVQSDHWIELRLC